MKSYLLHCLAWRRAATLALVIGAASALPAQAATSPDGMWSDVSSDRIAARGVRATVPDRYRSLSTDPRRLESTLRSAPPESAASGVPLTLPMPDGSYRTFLIKRSSIMAPELAKQFPEIRTYMGVDRDDAATIARLDMTPAGFHAMVLSPDGTVYIDPFQMGSRAEYISYDKHAYRNQREPHICAVTGKPVDARHSPLDHVERGGIGVGDTLRTYRLAVAATGEYTAFHGGTVGAAQAAIVTTVNRVSGIYERDLSIRLQLIANNTAIVYTNGATDPYTNSSGFAMLDENQANLTAVIGSANYDIGHVFSTGGGGVAGLGVVCSSSNKARGVTGSGSPVGDPFDVDFVAHEIGHQFGGNHTFNGTTSSCGGVNRNGSTAYEPGSGTTIQAYAGICGAENIQPNSDDNFHGVSYDEMTSYAAGSGACSANTATGNTAPNVTAGTGFTVPIGTPLLLGNEAVVSDVDAGQVLTYSWEQFDLGTASPPNTDSGNRPIFRSFKPQLTPIRFLPQMSDILANGTTLGESLPTTNRSLTFRLTARDNAANGGGVSFDTLAHTTTTAAGPFSVTSQSAPTIWPQSTSQTITWNVANTNAAPVNCASVILIFSDSGFAGFSGLTLAASTPNDGSETINTAGLPLTSTGRVMVKCTSNVFFDVNDANITVEPGTPSECGNIVLDAGEQCDDGNMANGDGCSSSCQIEAGFDCTAPVAAVPGTNVLPESGFESGAPNPAWTEASTNFGTPLCTTAFCGAGFAPNSGTWGVWFGGIAALESGSVEQAVVLAADDTELTFARRIAACDSQPDVVRLRIDGNEVWFADGASPDCFETGYQIESIDLTSAAGGPYNDGLLHTIRFESVVFANNGGISNFFVDDVFVLRGAMPAQGSVCTASGPPNDDIANAIELFAPGGHSGTLDGATPDGSNSENAGDDVWYSFFAASSGVLRVNTCTSATLFGTDTILSAHSGAPGTVANELAVNDDYAFGSDPSACDAVAGGSGLDSAFALNVSSGSLVYVRVSEFNNAGGGFEISLEFEPDVDTDGDGVVDSLDNCTQIFNPAQIDADGDGIGNLCDADLNNDCIVNPIDLGLFRAVFFGVDPVADLNSDGVVNPVDLGIFRSLFFLPPGPSGVPNICAMP